MKNFKPTLLAVFSFLLVITMFNHDLAIAEGETNASEPVEISKTAIRERTKELREQTGVELTKEERLELIDAFDQLSESEQCYEAQLNLYARIELYQANHGDLVSIYDTVLDNARSASDRLFDLKYKVADLNDSIDALEDDVFALKSSYFSLIDNLEENWELVCDEDFKDTNNLKDGLDHLAAIRERIADVEEEILNVMNGFKDLNTELKTDKEKES